MPAITTWALIYTQRDSPVFLYTVRSCFSTLPRWVELLMTEFTFNARGYSIRWGQVPIPTFIA